MSLSAGGSSCADLDDLRAESMSGAVLPLASFSVLVYEIALTRIFAYFFAYHFAVIAVSLALSGLGLGAWVRAAALRRLESEWILTLGPAALGVSFPLFCAAAVSIGSSALLLGISFLPFLLAGVLISACYDLYGAAGAHRAYFLDLGGGAAGCLLAVPLLGAAGAAGICLFLGAVGCCAAAWSRRACASRGSAIPGAFLATAAACGAFLAASGRISAQMPAAPLFAGKPLGYALRHERGRVVASAWGAAGRADLYEQDGFAHVKWIYNDGTNPSLMAAEPARPSQEEFLRGRFAYVPYAVRPPKEVLIIGSGGGLEVALAKLSGARRIRAVEVNGALVRLVRGWRSFAGPVYDQPGVELSVDEGRRFLETHREAYDLIQLSLVLTATAEAATYALVEGHLYTREAYRLYLDRLNPGGFLALIDDSPERCLRQFLSAIAALRERGLSLAEALRRVAVLHNPAKDESGYNYLLLMSPSALSGDATRALSEISVKGGFVPLWVPGRAASGPFAVLADIGEAPFLARYPLNVAPCPDDAPYFFNLTKDARGRWLLLRPFAGAAAACLLAAVFWLWRLREGRRPELAAFGAIAALLGVGFMSVEAGLLQSLSMAAGGPAEALAAILGSILVFCALGARLAAVLARRFRWGVAELCLAAAGAVAATLLWLRAHGAWCFDASRPASLARAACVLAPCGLVLGMPFPALLAQCPGGKKTRLAQLWGINGLASVAGAALALAISLEKGTEATLWWGASVYASAGVAASIWCALRPAGPMASSSAGSP